MAQTEELRSKKWLMHKLYTKLGSHREISLHQLPDFFPTTFLFSYEKKGPETDRFINRRKKGNR